MVFPGEVKNAVNAAIIELRKVNKKKNNKENLKLLGIALVEVEKAIKELERCLVPSI